MQIKKLNTDTYAVYLEKGDSLNDSLTEFAREHNVKSASIQGIGAVQDVALGYFHSDTKTYAKKIFTQEYELVSCIGNITRLENNDPFVHIHIAIGGEDCSLKGGHCFAAEIAVVGEFLVQTFDETIDRLPNDSVGLKCWKLDHCNVHM